MMGTHYYEQYELREDAEREQMRRIEQHELTPWEWWGVVSEFVRWLVGR